MDYGNAKTPSMHRRLGSATVAAAFPWRRQPKFLMEEIPLGQYSCKKSHTKTTTTTKINRNVQTTVPQAEQPQGASQQKQLELQCADKSLYSFSFVVNVHILSIYISYMFDPLIYTSLIIIQQQVCGIQLTQKL